MQKFKSVKDILRTLHDEKSCREFLENIRWNGTPKCPHCDTESATHYRLTRNGVFQGKYKCRHCRKTFTVTVGTMFEGTHIPLYDWFYAIIQFLTHTKGISSVQLSKDLGITQKTAWSILHKIRCNLMDDVSKLRDAFSGIVQMDETYIGGKPKGKIWQNRGRSRKQKTPVFGLLTRDRVFALTVLDASANTLHTVINWVVKRHSTVVTDGFVSYNGLSKNYRHEIVEHNNGSYKNKRGFHTNGIEGFWGQLKRGLKSTYHSVGRKYLDRYCSEFSFRYNNRHLSALQVFLNFLSGNNFHVSRNLLLGDTT